MLFCHCFKTIENEEQLLNNKCSKSLIVFQLNCITLFNKQTRRNSSLTLKGKHNIMFKRHISLQKWWMKNGDIFCSCDTQEACNVFPRVGKVAILRDQYIMLRSDCHILHLIKTVSNRFTCSHIAFGTLHIPDSVKIFPILPHRNNLAET